MGVEFPRKEMEYIKKVNQELISSKATQEQIYTIEQQLREHMEESRLHGINPFDDLETPAEFVREYLEIHEVPHQRKNTLSKKHYLMGFLYFAVTYLVSQLILTMFLTQTFSPSYENADFNYNILYSISDNLWWNTTLITISLLSALFITSLVGLFSYHKVKRS